MFLPTSLSSRIATQAAKPTGLFGQLLGRVMSFETGDANRVGVDLLSLRDGDDVLEVGYGHGKTLQEIARRASVRLAGIDHSDAMRRQAAVRNRSLVRSGRLDLRRGDAAALPFANEAFDRALCVHTLYFWRDLGGPFAELARVLVPEGLLVLGYKDTRDVQSFDRYPAPTYLFRPRPEIEAALVEAGFDRVATSRSEGPAPICFTVATRGEVRNAP